MGFWLVGRDAPDFQPVTTPIAKRFAVFRREPLTWVLALVYFVTFGGFVAIANYLPTLLVSTNGLQPTRQRGLRAFVVLATLPRPVGGVLADRWGGARILNATSSTRPSL